MISLPGYDAWKTTPPDNYIDPNAVICWRCEAVLEKKDLCTCGSGECKDCCQCKIAWKHYRLMKRRGKMLGKRQ